MCKIVSFKITKIISLDGIRIAYNGPTRIAYNGPTLESFCSFQKQFHRKTVDFSGIQTRTIRVEFEHAGQLTTTGFKLFSPLFSAKIFYHLDLIFLQRKER